MTPARSSDRSAIRPSWGPGFDQVGELVSKGDRAAKPSGADGASAMARCSRPHSFVLVVPSFLPMRSRNLVSKRNNLRLSEPGAWGARGHVSDGFRQVIL